MRSQNQRREGDRPASSYFQRGNLPQRDSGQLHLHLHHHHYHQHRLRHYLHHHHHRRRHHCHHQVIRVYFGEIGWQSRSLPCDQGGIEPCCQQVIWILKKKVPASTSGSLPVPLHQLCHDALLQSAFHAHLTPMSRVVGEIGL